jgi:hypothetical protein
MNNDKILRLQIYIEACKIAIKTAQNPEKKAFFERELRKTISKLEQLNK